MYTKYKPKISALYQLSFGFKKKMNEKRPQIHTKLFVRTRSNVTRVHRLTPYPGHSKIRSVGHPLQLLS